MPHRLTRFLPIMIFLGCLLLSGFLCPAAASTKLYVKDGDSFVLGTREIRLWGIDAVELHQFCWQDGREYPCGRQAREYLVSLIDPDELQCQEKPRAKSETRTVAQCFVAGDDLADLMVRGGWAIDYRYFSHGFYAAAQDQAQIGKRGIWGGTFQTPREWRKSNKY